MSKENLCWGVLDVGVDGNDFFPLSMEEAIEKANNILY